MKPKKNLTARFAATLFTYWCATTGAASFATTYLLDRGLSAGIIGTLLAAGGLLACLTQPILASAADRSRKFLLVKMLLVLSIVSSLCFALQLLPQLPMMAAGLLYMCGMWSADTVLPLLNALNVACEEDGYHISFGTARGFGAIASALSSLGVGFLIAKAGMSWMIGYLLLFRVLSIVVLASYPKIRKALTTASQKDESCSVPQFFLRYRWYCVSLLGVLCLGMFHAMTENYLITVMERLGGDSSHVGTALFISAFSGSLIMFLFVPIRNKLGNTRLMMIAALSFLLKAVLFYFSGSITAIYLLELLQMTSYAFLAPTQVYYANSKVRTADMVKGQAFISAAYALGCSAGNFAGGQLLRFGVDTMLAGGIVMALTGAVIFLFTLKKTDLSPLQT